MRKVLFLGAAAAGMMALASGCTSVPAEAGGGGKPATVRAALCSLGYSAIAMRALPSGHHIAEVTLNGKPATFVVDTGAGRTVIHAPYARDFLGDAAATVRGQAIGAGGSMALTGYPVGQLSIAGTGTQLRQIFAVDLGSVVKALEPMAGKPVQGIIGQDLMQAQRAIVDVQQSALYLMPVAGEKARC